MLLQMAGYACMYVYMYVCIHCLYICMCVYIIYMCVCIYVHICLYIYAYMYRYNIPTLSMGYIDHIFFIQLSTDIEITCLLAIVNNSQLLNIEILPRDW